MQDEYDDKLVIFMKQDEGQDYTIPDIMTALNVKSREKVVASISRLEGGGQVEKSRRKGRAQYYRLKRKNSRRQQSKTQST